MQVCAGRFDAGVFVDFLAKLVHDTDGPVFLVLGNHSVHKAQPVRDYADSLRGRRTLFFRPPYSPEVNPDEWVWKNVKHDQIARSAVTRTSELHTRIERALRRLQDLPDIVRGFFRAPALVYINAA